MDNSEQFILKERESARRHKQIMLGSLCGALVMISISFSSRSCSTAEIEHDREILESFNECLQTKSVAECEHAYYPDRKVYVPTAPKPPAPQMTASEVQALEERRASVAHKLYTHCTEKAAVDDDECPGDVQQIMESIASVP